MGRQGRGADAGVRSPVAGITCQLPPAARRHRSPVNSHRRRPLNPTRPRLCDSTLAGSSTARATRRSLLLLATGDGRGGREHRAVPPDQRPHAPDGLAHGVRARQL